MPKSPSSRALAPYRRAVAAATSGILLVSALALTAPVAAAADARTFALVGDLQSELGCSADWQPDCTVTELAPTSTPDVYAAEFEIPAGSFEYKVAVDDAWDEAYGLDGGGDNIPLTVAGPSTVRVVFDDVQHRVGLELLSVRGDHTSEDDALVDDPVRQAGDGKQFYFVMTDRFANGDPANDTGGLTGDRLATGFDPTSTGFYQGGDIAGLRANLDYIKGLGTTAIWLTPSFMNKPVQGEGENISAGYHGYWITDFTRIDPHLGTNAELEAFIDEAHAEGIDVYFDIITNHTADVITYEEGEYAYIDQATKPYRDANGDTFDPADYAGTDDFPELDAATSFPYTPVIAEDEQDVKVPSWLNDPTLYHNRGDSTWTGESVTYGDFVGLDDLMTEHPDVVSGFVEVYQDWIDLGIDGFRIDTAKHVNFEFWEEWTTEVREYAASVGKDDFFMFGEVYDADPALLAPYVRDSDMNSVLDFGFQSAATSFAKGGNVSTLARLFEGDDRYTTPDSSATALPTFLGNHDMGRIGYFLDGTDDALQRDRLAHDLMFLSRGQPVVYYGDEQGFVGAGGDRAARQSLFGTQTPEYRDQQLITGETVGTDDRYDTEAPVYTHVAALSELRAAHPALGDGAQIERYAADGVYAFSRVDREERTEYLVALNNTAEAQTVEIPTLTADADFAPLYGTDAAVTTDAAATGTVQVPALSAVVLRADGEVTAPAEAAPLTVSAPVAGAGVNGSTAIGATADESWRETSFAWRVAGSDEWTPLGTAEDTTPGVFADVRGLADGTLLEYRAVSTDAAGQRSAASTYASVGNRVNLVVEEEPEEPEEPTAYDAVSIPGSLNTEMGCGSDWAPDCDQAQMALVDGKWRLNVDLAAGTYEYKVATERSWDENYGADGVAGGANIVVTHPGGPITFLFDPLTKRVQSSSEGPVVTLAGSFQSELGCAADWSAECLRAMMFDGDRDGVYEFSTKGIPTGSYEVKVAHGLSWDENYGADGVRGGENIAFTATAGKAIVFRYDSETHVLEIEAADPPLAGTGESRAHWIDADTVAWPTGLGDGTEWQLYGSADAALEIAAGDVAGGEPIALTPVDGGLTEAQRERFPALAEFTALRVEDVDRDAAAELLRGQLRVAQRDASGALTAFTGVQIPGVLDDLYAEAVADDALGVSFSGKGAKTKTTFRLWAPTAQSATLLTWDAGGTGDPVRHDASFDAASGTWTAAGGRALVDDEYLWEVVVFAPSTDEIETNTVTDPASVALTENSTRSVAISLADKAYMPKQWQKAKPKPVERNVDRAIYELHIRDFSITDETVPEAERGTYAAFSRKSAGTAQLRQLAEAGINTVHLLPSFDIATIEEDRAAQAEPDCDLASLPPGSGEQQACIAAVADTDGFNWGYDPFHFTTPEGSYALDADGGARVSEFRGMVGALHGMGLQVVLDQVFNHTAASGQDGKSVLDQIVPGYYHRLNLAGSVETSTCCQNIATEHEVAEKLMVDSVVTWARDYKVDGFRFDLMGHHSKANMLAVREALDELTVKKDGVDGSTVHLYGEGWNFGEVADNALFEQATQGQLGGTGIATFNDRLRDAVHGGSPVDSGSTFRQGYGTGLGTDPNGDPINGSTDEALADLARQTDLVKLGLTGNLRDYELPTADGSVRPGSELDYNGQSAGYADQPDEVINYVDAHDNETLYDLSVLKLPVETSMADRVRMNTLSLATVTLSQSPSFWHAGTELLRSKSLDRNSYNSGDWFNRIDWTGQESTFGSGLPPAADNEEKWPIMAPLLENAALKPTADDIAAAEASALDLLRVRSEVGLLRLGSAAAISEKVSFPNSGPDADPGVIVMQIDDLVGADADRALDGALVVFNASPEATTQTIDDLAGRGFVLSAAQARGSDAVVKTTTWDAATGTVTVPARSVAVLVDAAPVATAVVAMPTPPVAKQGAAVRMTGKVIAVDGSAPVGTVTVMEGSKTLASAELPASAKGRINLPLPKLSKGVHVLRTSFTGAQEHADSRSLVPIPLLVY